MRVLDLFCGLGGWSKGFDQEGFEVLGVDIVDVGYPFDLIIQDVRTLDGERFRGFDVIVGSPPCRDFSVISQHYRARAWRNPIDPMKGLELVDAFLRVIREAEPQYWLMENVPGLCKYLSLKPRCKPRLTPTMRRVFWGNFPAFLIPTVNRPKIKEIHGKLQSWKRAEIPTPISNALATAIKSQMESA